MRRAGARPLGIALARLTAELAPRTLLAEVQTVWPDVVGEQLAAHCTPDGERGGSLAVACSASVWAQELDLLSEVVVARLNERLSRPAITGLRPQARQPR